MNGYGILADTIVASHVAYVAFVVLGQLAILVGWPLGWSWIRNPWFRIIHLTMILVVVAEASVQFECPLTTWEYDLRVKAGQLDPKFREEAVGDFKDISFIGRNLNALMHYDNASGYLQWCYYGFGALVLLTLVLVPPRFRRAAPPRPVVREPIPEPPTISEPATAIIPPGTAGRGLPK